MKLLELQVENYGVFRSRHFRFGEGLQLIHGPNEAGKSTLLMLLRELFFGFAERNPYAFAEHSGKMSATARLATAKGRGVEFCRHKRRKEPVVGKFLDTGDPIDEAGLTRLLDNASRNTFESLFAFSLVDLAAGQEGLVGAAAQDAIFGSGAGGLKRFQLLQKSIDTQLDSLFKPKAKIPFINNLVDRIEATTSELAASIVKPSDYDDLCRQRDELAKRELLARKACHDCAQEKSRAARLAKAVPVGQELALAQAELNVLDAPDGLPENLAAEFDKARQTHAHAEDEVRDAEEKGAACEQQLDGVHRRPQPLAHEAEIMAVFREAAGMRAAREAIPRLRGDAKLLRHKSAAAVADLHPDWTLDDLERLRVGVAVRERIDRLAHALLERQNQQRAVAAKRREKAAKLTEDRQSIERLDAVPAVPRLEAVCQREPQYRGDLAGVVEWQQAADQLAQRIGGLFSRLVASVTVADGRLEEIALPLAALIEPFRDRFEQAEAAMRAARERIDAAGEDLRRMQDDLRQLAACESLPDRQQLLDRRSRRDQAWRLIRRQYIAGEQVAAEVDALLQGGGLPLPEHFEGEMAAADRLADQRQEKAELVARHDQLAGAIAAKRLSLAELEGAHGERDAVFETLRSEWRAFWSRLGIEPQPPKAMLEWLALHAEWCDARLAHGALEAKRQAAGRRIADFQIELCDALGSQGPVDSLLPLARQRAAEAAEAASQRKMLAAGIAKQQRQLAETDAELESLSGSESQWAAQWQALLQELGFAADWDVATVQKILAGLAGAQRDYQEVARLEQEAAGQEAALEAYSQRVANIGSLDGESPGAVRPEDAAEHWHRTLEEARKAHQRYEGLAQQLGEFRSRAAAKRELRDGAQRQSAAILELAGAADEESFRRILAGAARQRQLSSQVESATRELRRLAEGEDFDVFLASLSTADVDQLALELTAAQQRHAALEEEYRQAISAAALMDKQVRDLDGDGKATLIVQQREGLHAMLRDRTGDYAVLKFAAAMLRQSLARFEREHQPAIFAEAGALLARMTCGRYVCVRTRLDEKGSLEVEDAIGAAKTPEELSTGTREQLHLALRLAHARHYCRSAEPLPLVMDDVLVNFDDQRAAAALETLCDMAGQTQVILLTCHATTVARVAKILPQAAIIDLAAGEPAAGGGF